ncbi:MAG: hypothetical protein ACOYJ2_01760 [Rickettsiales bacterium]
MSRRDSERKTQDAIAEAKIAYQAIFGNGRASNERFSALSLLAASGDGDLDKIMKGVGKDLLSRAFLEDRGGLTDSDDQAMANLQKAFKDIISSVTPRDSRRDPTGTEQGGRS